MKYAKQMYSPQIGINSCKRKVFYLYEITTEGECWLNADSIDILQQIKNRNDINTKELNELAKKFWDSVSLELSTDTLEGFTESIAEIIKKNRYLLDKDGNIKQVEYFRIDV